MEKENVFIHLENVDIDKRKIDPIFLEFDIAKAMIPIYVFHRSQGCDEDEARTKAFKEMTAICKSIAVKYSKPDQSKPSNSQ
jgi:hypothetical protein